MNTGDLKKRLAEAPVLAQLDSKQQSEVEEVLRLPGLVHLWSLMLGARQGLYVALAEAHVMDMSTVARLSVIQGTIKGIEVFHQTLVEQTVPADGQNGAE